MQPTEIQPAYRMVIAVALIGGNTYMLASSCTEDNDLVTWSIPRFDATTTEKGDDDEQIDQIKALWSSEDRALTDGGDDGPLGSGMAFSTLPPVWDCLLAPSKDRDAERQGMEIFAWRLFIATNWPGVYTGSPEDGDFDAAPSLAGAEATSRRPRWAGWYTPEQLLLRLDGGVPPEERDQPFDGWSCNDRCLEYELRGAVFAVTHGNKPVYDQAGNRVRYEVRLEPTSFFNQFRFLARERPLDAGSRSAPLFFVEGQCLNSYAGTIAVKLAWKELTAEEAAGGRYLSRRTPDADGGSVTLGLVGFHIMQKPENYEQWVWATFEHSDNFLQPPGSGVASFYNPGCHNCVNNETRRSDVDQKCRTQVIPTLTPGGEAVELVDVNARFRAWAKNQGSVLQHYRLIGVQFTASADRPYPGNDNGDFGPPTPGILRNSVIETYLDGHSHACGPCDECDAGAPDAGDAPFLSSRCMNCHSFAGNGNKWQEGDFDFTSFHDFSFVAELHLCDPKENGGHWLGEGKCRLLAGKPDGGRVP